MFEGLQTIFLICRNLEISRKFYSDTLGLKETSVKADHIRYEAGTVSLVIHTPISDNEMRTWNLDPISEPRGSGLILALQAVDVDEAHANLVGKGADILSPPRDAPWGVRMFLMRDPNGFLIEVSRPVSSQGSFRAPQKRNAPPF